MSQAHRQIDPLGAALCNAAPPLPRDFTQTVMACISAEVRPAERVADRVHRLAGRRWTLAGRRWRLAVVALVLSMPLGAGVGAVRASATSLPTRRRHGLFQFRRFDLCGSIPVYTLDREVCATL